VEDGRYRRTISLNGRNGYFEVVLAEGRDALLLRIAFSDPRSLFFIVERVRSMFDLNADWAAIVQDLRSDPVLRASLEAEPGIRVPGCWNGFELAVRAILGQQITVRGATTMAGRMANRFGKPFRRGEGLTHIFPTAEVLADAPLREIGITGKRIETIKALARAVRNGKIRFEKGASSESLLNRLIDIAGIGKWTTQYVAMRALGEPDAFPSNDLGLLHAMDLGNSRDLELRAEPWRPWRAYAAMYLWRICGQRSTREDRVTRKHQEVAAEINVFHQPMPIVV
jgi:AraC family transcriptional regulator, regulatory protein of adaptative response / DNA-3-methyladenine glycosylase II